MIRRGWRILHSRDLKIPECLAYQPGGHARVFRRRHTSCRGDLSRLPCAARSVSLVRQGYRAAYSERPGRALRRSANPRKRGADGRPLLQKWCAHRDGLLAWPSRQRNREHPSNFALPLTNDIAMIVLSSSLPGAPIPIEATPIATGTWLTTIGYGCTTKPAPSSGCKLSSSLNGLAVQVVAHASCGGVASTSLCVSSGPNSAVNVGDSGGPVMLQRRGQWYLAGIVSSQAVFRSGHYVSGVTAIPGQMSWINSVLASLTPQSPFPTPSPSPSPAPSPLPGPSPTPPIEPEPAPVPTFTYTGCMAPAPTVRVD